MSQYEMNYKVMKISNMRIVINFGINKSILTKCVLLIGINCSNGRRFD